VSVDAGVQYIGVSTDSGVKEYNTGEYRCVSRWRKKTVRRKLEMQHYSVSEDGDAVVSKNRLLLLLLEIKKVIQVRYRCVLNCCVDCDPGKKPVCCLLLAV